MTALDRARRKAYLRLLPLLFLSFVIAYVDRTNVALAKLTMMKDLPGFDNAVIGLGAGVFFLGYFLLEIPGALLVERWSARKWLGRIMISWGLVAALTAWVKTPSQFYLVRFLLGLAEAGFFPGVIVFLTHWFPARDRARAFSCFFVAIPFAQIVSPKISNLLLQIGTDGRPELWGLEGWQCLYVFWGLPAVLLGFCVLRLLTDRPAEASWLRPDERAALEGELAREKALAGTPLQPLQAIRHPRVLQLALAYFFVATANYGVEFFLPSILDRLYALDRGTLTWLILLPPAGSVVGQLLVGWSSDRTRERRLHTAVPLLLTAGALALVPATSDSLPLTLALFVVALTGLKAYLPAFWALPGLFLSQAAAAASIGFINSVGNLGGFVGPFVLGRIETFTGSFAVGIQLLAIAAALAALTIVLTGRRSRGSGSLTASPSTRP